MTLIPRARLPRLRIRRWMLVETTRHVRILSVHATKWGARRARRALDTVVYSPESRYLIARHIKPTRAA